MYERPSRGKRRFTLTTLLTIVFLICFVFAAFDRGDYLFGRGVGVLYTIFAFVISWLVLHSMLSQPFSRSNLTMVVFVSSVFSLACAFPTVWAPNSKYFIDKQHYLRSGRVQIEKILAEDPIYENLDISVYKKHNRISVEGTVDKLSVVNDLKSQIRKQCEFGRFCHVFFEVQIEGRPNWIYQSRLSGGTWYRLRSGKYGGPERGGLISE